MEKQNYIHKRFVEGKGGLPVLFLHGFLETGEVWLKWLSDYSLENPVFIPDLPGHGKSPGWDGQSQFSEWAGFLMKSIEHQLGHAAEFHIVGHSMGGYLAFEMARLFPDKVKKLVLFHSTPMPDAPSAIESRQRQINLIEKGRRRLLIKNVGPQMFAPQNRKRLAKLGEQLNGLAQSCPADGMIKTLWTIMNRKDFRPVMEKRCKDILWITGGKDPFMPPDHIAEVAEKFPGAHHEHFKDCGHAAFLEKPKEAMAIMRKFLG